MNNKENKLFNKYLLEYQKQLPFTLTPKDIKERKLLPHGMTKIYELLEQGEIPSQKIGGKWVIPRDQFLSWLFQVNLKDNEN